MVTQVSFNFGSSSQPSHMCLQCMHPHLPHLHPAFPARPPGVRQHQPPCDALMHDCVNSKPLPSLLILFILQALTRVQQALASHTYLLPCRDWASAYQTTAAEPEGYWLEVEGRLPPDLCGTYFRQAGSDAYRLASQS